MLKVVKLEFNNFEHARLSLKTQQASYLLREGLIHAGSFLRELLYTIDVVLLFQNRLRCCFSNGEVVQVAAVPLVKEQLVPCPGDHNVPGVD